MMQIERKIYTPLMRLAVALVLLTLAGCGEVPPDMPTPVPNVGRIVISGSLQYHPDSTFYPDSIGVVLDDDSLGFHDNPYAIDDIQVGVHAVRVYLDFAGRIISGTERDVEVIFNETTDVGFNIMTGGMEVLSVLELSADSTMIPDSAGVILDGDSLGFQANPAILTYIPKGTHTVSTYVVFDGRDYLGPARGITVNFAEVTDVRIPMVAGGVIAVNADYDGSGLDSLGIQLDGVDLGVDIAPRIISNIDAGVHKLVAYALIDTVRLEAWRAGVDVALAETTSVDMTLQAVAPFVGSHAPNIECVDIDGNGYSLFDHWGEVIYLYFFEHT